MNKFNKEDFSWSGIEKMKYKEDNSPFKDVTRQILFDGSFDMPCQFRYFEVGEGGYSTLESHQHTHFVMIFRGKGQCLLNDEVSEVSVGDTILIPSNTMHQFRANRGEKLGFLCLVDKNRDKVKLPSHEVIENYKKDKTIAEFLGDYSCNIPSKNKFPLKKYEIDGDAIEVQTCEQFKGLPIEFGVTTSFSENGEVLNMALHTGDKKETVLNARKKVAKAFGVNWKDMVFANQVHGINVKKITKKDLGAGSDNYETSIPECDGMYTNEVGVPLAICVADCLPVLLYDPVQKAMAAIHAGWRGVYGEITNKAIKAMEREYDSKREDIMVYVGPSIACESFEVSDELADKFAEKFGKEVVRDYENNEKELRKHVDLKQAILHSLVGFGVLTANVNISPTDTFKEELYFSYRRENGDTGRIALVAILR